MMLWACSSDELSETPAYASGHEMPIELAALATPYEDGAEARSTSRRTSWNPPYGYNLYESLYDGSFINIPDLSQSTIDLFMTHDNTVGEAATVKNPLNARLRYVSATNKWKLMLPNDIKNDDDVQEGNYYAYGFIPRDAANSASIEKLPEHSNWADGAVLTILGMKAVATDPCVIIGAKHGFSEDYDGEYIDRNGNSAYDEGTDTRTNRLRAGNFQFKLDTGKRIVDGKEVINPNYLYFLFDHLYSAFSISMRVQGDYNALRTIKLKALYLKTKNSSGATAEKTDVTVTLIKNDSETNPISNITYAPSTDETKSDSTIYKNREGFPLTTEYSSFLGHFMPQGVSTLILTSLYDVYDTKGNLIRENCKATNTMVLKDLLTDQLEAKRGWRYQVNMTINPTYLYVLSEPDLNNPTVIVE